MTTKPCLVVSPLLLNSLTPNKKMFPAFRHLPESLSLSFSSVHTSKQCSQPVWLLTSSGRSGNTLLPLALYWSVEVQSAVWPVCCGHVSVSQAIAVVTPALHPPPSCTRSALLTAVHSCHKAFWVQTHPRSWAQSEGVGDAVQGNR